MILDIMQRGGYFMWIIAFVGLISLVIMADRLVRIWIIYSIDGEGLMKQITKHIMGDNIDRAIGVCDTNSRAALSQVLKAGLTKANKSEVDIQNAIDEKTLEVLPRVQTRINYLPTLANLSTLLGLLGTVIGLIQAFNAVAVADPARRQQVLTQGIEIAMYATAFGLVVAIPVVFIHAFINNQANGIIDNIDEYSVKLINLLVSRSRAMTRRSPQ